MLDVIEGEGLVENARKVGEYLMEEVDKMTSKQVDKLDAQTSNSSTRQLVNSSTIKEVRGRGLMIGIELDQPYKEVRQRLLFEEHVFTGCAGTNVLRLLPPLCMSIEDADEFIVKLKKVL